MNHKVLDFTALTIAIIGAVNWGLIGFFSFDLVAFIFGNMSWFSRIVYALVGICGLYLISFYMNNYFVVVVVVVFKTGFLCVSWNSPALN